MTPLSRAVTLAAALAAAVLAILLTGSPAHAHILLTKAQPNGDGSTTLTFALGHGCANAPTTELTIVLPPGVTGSTTTQPPGWVKSSQTTTGTVTWTGPAIPSGTNAEFSITTRITGTIGQRFRFPTVQRCDNGDSYHWIDTEPGAEHPAPTLIATAAVLTSTPPPTTPTPTTAPNTASGARLPQVLGGLGALILTAAAVGYALTRRDPTSHPDRGPAGQEQGQPEPAPGP